MVSKLTLFEKKKGLGRLEKQLIKLQIRYLKFLSVKIDELIIVCRLLKQRQRNYKAHFHL